MGSRKVNTEDIDEELLIASIGRRTQDGNTRPAQEPPAVPAEESTGGTEPPAAKEKTSRESSRRKRQEEDYMMFLRRNELKTRQCVYISRDVHSKILKIVNDIAGREITVGGYVDTVLRQQPSGYRRTWKSCRPHRQGANTAKRSMNGCSSGSPGCGHATGK